jgi:hypothetical protein
MATEIGSVASGLVQGVSQFTGGVGRSGEVTGSSTVAQQSQTSQDVSVGTSVSGTFINLSDIKDVAAKAANSVQEAEKALLGINQGQANSPALDNPGKTDTTAQSGEQKPGSSAQVDKSAQQRQVNETISEEQAAYLARLNLGRISLQAQLDKLAGMLDVNLQQVTSEVQAQVVGHTAAGQLAIVLQSLGNNSNTLANIGQ